MFLSLCLCAAAAFAFQILASSWLGFCLMGWYPQQAFALAFVGSAAAALFVGFRGRPRRRPALGWAAAAFAVALLAAQVGIVLVQAWSVSQFQAPGEWSFQRVIATLIRNRPWLVAGFAASLLVPFFLHGLFVAALFRRLPRNAYPKLIAIEFLGAALGSIGGALAIDGLPQPVVWSALLGCAFLGAAAWPVQRRRRTTWRVGIASAAIAVFALEGIAPGRLEPPFDAHFLARDYRRRSPVEIPESTWTTYARVTTAKVGDVWLGMLGNGEGQAFFRPFRPEVARQPDDLPAALAAALDHPKASLVLFAGAGQELISLRIEAASDAILDGVELNGRLIEQSQRIPELNLAQLFQDPRVRLHEGDARRFLEAHPSSYDLVLYSWPGTTAAQQLGLGGSTVGPCYTKEGLIAALGALRPGGTLVILGGLKRELVALLREWSDERHGTPFPKQLVLLRGGSGDADGYSRGNAIRVLFRPDGFTAEQVARLDPELRPAAHHVAWADGRALEKGLEGITRIAVEPDWRRIASELGVRLLRDDFPMYLPPLPETIEWSEIGAFALLILSLMAWLGGRARDLRAPTPLRLGVYFVPVGAGFLAIQSIVLAKMAAYFGSPTRALAFGLPLHLLSVAAGLWRQKDWESPTAARSCWLGAAAGVLWLIVGESHGRPWLVGAPLPVVCAAWLLWLLPVGYYGGQLYPRGLCLMGRHSVRAALWAMAVDTVAGAWALAAVPWIVYFFGLNQPLAALAAVYAAGSVIAFQKPRTVSDTVSDTSGLNQRQSQGQKTGGQDGYGEVVVDR